MTLQVEELLLLKLLQFFGYVQLDDDVTGSNEDDDECIHTTQRFVYIFSAGEGKGSVHQFVLLL